MIDRAEIYVKGGDGGGGVVSFRREKYVPFGGPDGGDGGNGGSVYLVGDGHVGTLAELRYRTHFEAARGGDGRGRNMTGKAGDDIEIKIPLGTIVRRKDPGNGTSIMADVVSDGYRVQVAKGGRGGQGNAHFASPTNRAPRRATSGKPGEEAWLVLDLKLIADVGVVGYPNAGKSTLLRRVSRARPKVADYPFTTTEPVLGVVETNDRAFVMADIPGIIEGAHTGRGLGLEFLRHIERTRVLIHMIDGMSEDPVSEFHKVQAEFDAYAGGLEDKPALIAVNKIDLPAVRDRIPDIRQKFAVEGYEPYFISAASGEGVDILVRKTLEVLSRRTPGTAEEVKEEFKVFRPRPLSPKKPRRAQKE